jgi:hypothetical protein
MYKKQKKIQSLLSLAAAVINPVYCSSPEQHAFCFVFYQPRQLLEEIYEKQERR